MAEPRGKKEVLKRFKEIKKAYLRQELERVCEALLYDMYEERQYMGFTGNTQTSYTLGLYLEGKLVYVLAIGDSLDAPVRLKVQNGEVAYLTNPYEGEPRKVTGSVDIKVNKTGQGTAMAFLKSYKARKKGFTIVATTGTEYSEYIEEVRHLNVLSNTKESAKQILVNNFKPIA